jgi:hypothetical protein
MLDENMFVFDVVLEYKMLHWMCWYYILRDCAIINFLNFDDLELILRPTEMVELCAHEFKLGWCEMSIGSGNGL